MDLGPPTTALNRPDLERPRDVSSAHLLLRLRSLWHHGFGPSRAVKGCECDGDSVGGILGL